MSMSKMKSDKSVKVLNKGTSNHMSGRNFAGAQTSGQTTAGGAKSSTPKENFGGKGHMVPQQYAGEQTPGQTTAGGASKKGAKFCAEGGKGPNNHMFGKMTAATAKPA